MPAFWLLSQVMARNSFPQKYKIQPSTHVPILQVRGPIYGLLQVGPILKYNKVLLGFLQKAIKWQPFRTTQNQPDSLDRRLQPQKALNANGMCTYTNPIDNIVYIEVEEKYGSKSS